MNRKKKEVAARVERHDLWKKTAGTQGEKLCQENLSCIESDFSGLDLSDAEIPGADFTGAKLTDTNFTGCNLASADFQFASLLNASFNKANLCKSRLIQLDATGADFRGADLNSSNLSGSNFLRAKFDDKTHFENTLIVEASLGGAIGLDLAEVKSIRTGDGSEDTESELILLTGEQAQTWLSTEGKLKRLSFDVGTECNIYLSIAERNDFPDLNAFLVSAVSAKNTAHFTNLTGLAEPFDKLSWPGSLRNDLEQYVGIKVPKLCKWPTYRLDNHEFCEEEVLIEANELFIHVHSTCSG